MWTSPVARGTLPLRYEHKQYKLKKTSGLFTMLLCYAAFKMHFNVVPAVNLWLLRRFTLRLESVNTIYGLVTWHVLWV